MLTALETYPLFETVRLAPRALEIAADDSTDVVIIELEA